MDTPSRTVGAQTELGLAVLRDQYTVALGGEQRVVHAFSLVLPWSRYIFLRFASDEQLDFPVVYASALRGYASLDSETREGDMRPLFETIVEQVAPPPVNVDGPFQMRVSSLDYSSYVGVIGIGRVQRGTVKPNQQICVIDVDGHPRNARVLQVLGFHGLERIEVPSARAGDIIAITGVENLQISDTLCDRSAPEALPALTVDEPTISMTFRVNNSPFAGRDGKYLTSRHLRERLQKELRKKEKALAEAAARLLVTKKMQALWGEAEED